MNVQHQDLQSVGVKLNKYMSSLHPLEVVGRANETTSSGENLLTIAWQFKC